MAGVISVVRRASFEAPRLTISAPGFTGGWLGRSFTTRRERGSAVFEAENLRDWRGYDVVDERGGKIGSLEAVYVDTSSDVPSFATVKIGGLARKSRLVFVPLTGATVAPKHVRVQVAKNDAKSAPSIDLDGELLADAEPSVFEHYGMTYIPGAGGERRLARR